MSVRALVVDDEPLARERVRALLERYPGIRVVGECGDGVAAVAAIRRERPDLLLLDVQMPGLDGFGVVANLHPREVPVTVFVTAYDEHALRAFDVGAADYVLKPIQPERFRTAVERALERVSSGGRRPHRDLEPVLRQVCADGGWLSRFVVERRGRMTLLPVEAVRWLEGADNYVCVHGVEGDHLLRTTLRELERQLDPAGFARIHRSAIVALGRIAAVEPGSHADAVVVLDDGTRLRVSRRRAGALRERLRGRAHPDSATPHRA
ncbi:MAG TPA: LytTR family DNA-binding domain-containing protein [Longimicrobiaceae bacterium]|nr:LytTR family DNA-binding domain-containing protein [Longimicrobiaceae bacterium]